MTESIGERLLRLRRERGLSQRDVSGPGISYTYISRIEAGQRRPSPRALAKIAARLGVSPEYVATGRELPPKDDRELRLGDAELQLRLDDDPGAEETMRDVLADAEAAGDAATVARARLGLAMAADRRGRHEQVVEILEDVVDADRPPVAEVPEVYALLGRSYLALGETARAISLFTRCLTELRASEPVDPILFVRFATHLSGALGEAGDPAGAQRTLADALEQADGISDRFTLIRLYWSLGRFHAEHGPAPQALGYVRRSIALLEATEDTYHLARAHQLAASILLDQASTESARRHLDRAESLFGSDAERADTGVLKTEQARLELELGDRAAARERALEALDALQDGEPLVAGHAWRTLADVFEAVDEPELAERAYRDAVAALADQGAGRLLAETYRSLGKFLRQHGREDEALDAFEHAADLAVAGAPGGASPRLAPTPG